MAISITVTTDSTPEDKILRVATVNKDTEGNNYTEYTGDCSNGVEIKPGESKTFTLHSLKELRIYEGIRPAEEVAPESNKAEESATA